MNFLNSIKRRGERAVLLLLAAALAALTAFGGCSRAGDNGGVTDEKLVVPSDTVVLAVKEDRTSREAQKRLEQCVDRYIEAFREVHPETGVKAVYYPELPKKLTGIDCLLLGADDMLLYAAGGLTDAEPYLGEYGFSASDLVGGAENVARIDPGEPLLMIPFNYDHTVVLGDRQLFEEAGVAVPGADWTIDGLEETAEALTGRQGSITYSGIYMPHYMNYTWQYFCNLLAGTYLTDGRFDFGSEGPVNTAVKRFYAFYAHNAAYTPGLSSGNRTCVMSLTFASMPGRDNLSFQTEKDAARNPGKRVDELLASGNLVLLPLPSASDGTRTGMANTDFIKGFAVNSGSKKQDMAGKLAAFCLTETAQQILNGCFGGIPSSRAMLQSDFWRKGVFEGANGDNALIGIEEGRRDDFTAALKGDPDIYNKNVRMRSVFSAVMVRELKSNKSQDKFIKNLGIFAEDANKVIDGKIAVYSREGVA
jgi:ABC-type glycerol-3-phosphate transport system substrate-binding protein